MFTWCICDMQFQEYKENYFPIYRSEVFNWRQGFDRIDKLKDIGLHMQITSEWPPTFLWNWFSLERNSTPTPALNTIE